MCVRWDLTVASGEQFEDLDLAFGDDGAGRGGASYEGGGDGVVVDEHDPNLAHLAAPRSGNATDTVVPSPGALSTTARDRKYRPDQR